MKCLSLTLVTISRLYIIWIWSSSSTISSTYCSICSITGLRYHIFASNETKFRHKSLHTYHISKTKTICSKIDAWYSKKSQEKNPSEVIVLQFANSLPCIWTESTRFGVDRRHCPAFIPRMFHAVTNTSSWASNDPVANIQWMYPFVSQWICRLKPPHPVCYQILVSNLRNVDLFV